MNEKLIKTLVTICAVFIILLVIIFGISSCTNKKRDFSEYEDKMLSVAKAYYKKNEDKLPKLDNKKILSLNEMISSDLIKEPSKFLNNPNASCIGEVIVYNNNGNYLYTPNLNCGTDFKTVLLKDKIIDDNLTTSGVGLYQVGNTYIMKGEVLNNYIEFNGIIFRIMRINDDGSIRVIQNKGFDNNNWDDRYISDTEYNSGLNEYMYNNINSRIKDTVEEYYKDEKVWSSSAKAYITTQDLCVGKRLEEDSSKNGRTECAKKINNQQFGLIAAYEYLQASLDKNCNYTTAPSCSNYNWIADLDSMWTITAAQENSSKVYKLRYTLSPSTADSMYGINVVFNLVGEAIYKSGNGSLEDPYKIR